MAKQVPWYQILHKLTEADQIVAYVADLMVDCQPTQTRRVESLERALFEARCDLLKARDDVRNAAVEVVRTPTPAEQAHLDILGALIQTREIEIREGRGG